MAYVQPNSTIQLFKGINLDNRYLHTIYFAGAGAQNTWFSGKVFKTYQQQSYTRYTTKQIKLQDSAAALLGVTYMRFTNNRTGDKWFYAFVNAIEYLNENTVLISYEIDVMQTWFIQNGSIKPCYVLREHVSDDTFGTNLEEEPVGSSEYDCDAIEKVVDNTAGKGLFSSWKVVINTTSEPVSGQGLAPNNLFNGTDYGYFPYTDLQTLVDYMYRCLGDWDKKEQKADIIDLFTFPAEFCDEQQSNNNHTINISLTPSLDGYTPKNKKLFAYPYSYLFLTTMDGDVAQYRWEYFDGDATQVTQEFHATGVPTAGGCVICYPKSYNGITDNMDAKVIMQNFPKNPFAYDAYQAWVAAGGEVRLQDDAANAKVRGAIGITKSVANLVGNIADMANPFSSEKGMYGPINSVNPLQLTKDIAGVVSGAANVASSIEDYKEAMQKVGYQFKDANYQPNIVVGKSSCNIAVAERYLDLYFFNVHVRADEAKRIDDFFSCFGYAINKVKTPNLHSRQYWNFVQTQNAVIGGDMPASSKEAIGRIFDGGITFWHNGDQVGNYMQSTSQGTINNPII